jgi:signal transduction histidine kinase
VNLLSNSLKFTVAGEVRVTMRRAEGGADGGAGVEREEKVEGGAAAEEPKPTPKAQAKAGDDGNADRPNGSDTTGGHGTDGSTGGGTGGLYVEISDTGPGISPQLKPRLFQKFVQVRESNRLTCASAGG